MKSVNRICLMMILCCVCCINIAQAAVNPKPFVIPELKEWKGNEIHSYRTNAHCLPKRKF